MRHLSRLLFVLGLLAAAPRQAPGQDPRLLERLDADTYAEVVRIIAEAGREGIPGEPLAQKALEGASKGAPGPRVVEAVRGLSQRMRTARSALGERTAPEDLVAAASALYVGAEPAMLRRMRERRPAGSLETAYSALAYLLQRGVAAEQSLGILDAMLAADARSVDFVSLQRLVEQDVRAGRAAPDAARLRARELVRQPVESH